MTRSDGDGSSVDRLDELADAAELMGDEATASRLRESAYRHRLEQMSRLPNDSVSTAEHPDGAGPE